MTLNLSQHCPTLHVFVFFSFSLEIGLDCFEVNRLSRRWLDCRRSPPETSASMYLRLRREAASKSWATTLYACYGCYTRLGGEMDAFWGLLEMVGTLYDSEVRCGAVGCPISCLIMTTTSFDFDILSETFAASPIKSCFPPELFQNRITNEQTGGHRGKSVFPLTYLL